LYDFIILFLFEQKTRMGCGINSVNGAYKLKISKLQGEI